MKLIGKTMHAKFHMRSLGLLAVVCLILAGCATLPDDGKDAKVMHFDNVRAMRYCEVFLIGGNGLTHNLQAGVYNTTGLNNTQDPRDTCPADTWAKVDVEALKKQYDVLGVFKNGPRYWANDWFQVPVGIQHDFDGLQARWFAQVQLPKGVDIKKKGSSGYHPTIVARKSEMGFVKGQPVFMLVDPDGMPWVMQAYTLIVDPNLTYTDLQTLGTKLKLPPGWKYQVKVLDQDLTIKAVNGYARIVQDDLENTYDACFTEGNEPACSYQP